MDIICPDTQPARRKRPRWAIGLSFVCGLIALSTGVFIAGCSNGRPVDLGANQSLVEIGELSLEQGESLEGQGRTAEANIAYRRALWAFRYHEQLTSEQPFLMEEALDGAERTSRKR